MGVERDVLSVRRHFHWSAKGDPLTAGRTENGLSRARTCNMACMAVSRLTVTITIVSNQQPTADGEAVINRFQGFATILPDRKAHDEYTNFRTRRINNVICIVARQMAIHLLLMLNEGCWS